MRREPSIKRAVSFIDGQNLYFAAREGCGYTYPNFDAWSLSKKVSDEKCWDLAGRSWDRLDTYRSWHLPEVLGFEGLPSKAKEKERRLS